MMDRSHSSPAVAIDESAWERLVAFTPEPACETERLHRLIRHALNRPKNIAVMFIIKAG